MKAEATAAGGADYQHTFSGCARHAEKAAAMGGLPAQGARAPTGGGQCPHTLQLGNGQEHWGCRGRRRTALQRAMLVRCFKQEGERSAWHTLPLKHVVESQQFDKVSSLLSLAAW